jgi:simple sugar transport system ATP-binding protein
MKKEAGTMNSLIRIVDATKKYQGIPAIQNVSLDFRAGEVHALLGENGAGKSTLTKALAGAVQLSSGEIYLDGTRIEFKSPAEALRAGIVMVYQETSLVPSMTVAQNIYLGEEKAFNRLRGLYIAAQQLLQSMSFEVDPTVYVSALGAAQKQMVEITRAVHHHARVIIFDEPTATLTPEEKQHFFDLVEKLRDQGVTIVFISHALEEALQIADRISVLRDGQLVLTEDAVKLDRDAIIRAMVGRDVEVSQRDQTTVQSADKHKVLSVENLTMAKIVKNNSFSVYAGEITGLFGLVGSGRSETAKIIAGSYKRNFFDGGKIFLNGKPVRFRIPAQAIRAGVVYVTEDRKLEGFFETMTIAENIYLGHLGARGKELVISAKTKAALAAEWIARLKVRAIGATAKVIELSGGNQQKVVLAKALVQKPTVVIFDEPTRGVDVGAIRDIHDSIRELAAQGIGVVVISSYLPEIRSLCDRILVCRQGRVVEEFDADSATDEKIMYAAVH